MTDDMAPCVFQLFFLPVFCWLCWILVPSLHLWRQGDWMKTCLCQSLCGCTYPSCSSLFHVVEKQEFFVGWQAAQKGGPAGFTTGQGRGCTLRWAAPKLGCWKGWAGGLPFSAARPFPHTAGLPFCAARRPALASVFCAVGEPAETSRFSFRNTALQPTRPAGPLINVIPLQTSRYLFLRVSHWVVPHWSVSTQFTDEGVIHRVRLSISTVGGYAKHSDWVSGWV